MKGLMKREKEETSGKRSLEEFLLIRYMKINGAFVSYREIGDEAGRWRQCPS
jgi:hypothetical protein